MLKNDELQIYRGKDFIINEKIKIHQPTLGEICDWGEEKYFSFVHTLTATPTDMKYQLHLAGIDWNTLTDFELFLLEYRAYPTDYTSILFGDLDFTSFEIMKCQDNDELTLYDRSHDIIIDRSVYEIITDYIRKSHNLTRNVEKAMNETTKNVLIEEARESIERQKNESYHSCLLPLISSLTNMPEFKYSWHNVWDMKINAFMDAVRQIPHIRHADLLLSSGYSGFGIDLKKVNKNDLNYFYRPDAN